MLNPPDTDALRALLERLFPDIHISSRAVALLAAQIAELENRCELMHDRIDYQPVRKAEATTVGMRVLLPHKIDREDKYGTNNYAK
jgi:hypothetical protein